MSVPPPGAASMAMVDCPNCGRQVPDGSFCGACGAELRDQSRRAGQRWREYAADPDQRVLRLSLVSTLLPHIPHRRARPFRIAFVVTAALLVVLGALRLTGASIAAAAVTVPVVYLLYLYDVEVYEDSPWVDLVVLAVGLALGLAWSQVTGSYVTRTLILNRAQGLDPGRSFIAAVVVPLVAELLVLLAPVVVLRTHRFEEALDGFTIGAASALGFTSAATLAQLAPELRGGLVVGGSAVANGLRMLQRGLFLPIVYASTAGVIGAALWVNRSRRRGGGVATSLAASVLVTAVVLVLLGVVNVTVQDRTLTAVIYGIVTAAVVLWVRVALHHLLLAESAYVEMGPDMACSHCHRVVPRMAFCSNCGIAVRATPKVGEGRTARRSS